VWEWSGLASAWEWLTFDLADLDLVPGYNPDASTPTTAAPGVVAAPDTPNVVSFAELDNATRIFLKQPEGLGMKGGGRG
jgi:hypothetical protein